MTIVDDGWKGFERRRHLQALNRDIRKAWVHGTAGERFRTTQKLLAIIKAGTRVYTTWKPLEIRNRMQVYAELAATTKQTLLRPRSSNHQGPICAREISNFHSRDLVLHTDLPGPSLIQHHRSFSRRRAYQAAVRGCPAR